MLGKNYLIGVFTSEALAVENRQIVADIFARSKECKSYY
jgi:hypothetical protein